MYIQHIYPIFWIIFCMLHCSGSSRRGGARCCLCPRCSGVSDSTRGCRNNARAALLEKNKICDFLSDFLTVCIFWIIFCMLPCSGASRRGGARCCLCPRCSGVSDFARGCRNNTRAALLAKNKIYDFLSDFLTV